MENVKSVPDGGAHLGESDEPERRGWLSWLAAWRGSTGDRASAKDPTLWRHRDVTT